MSSNQSLLDLQDLDTKLDQLAHRRANLAERARIEELTSQLQRGEQAKEVAFRNLREKQSAQKALEDESALSSEKKASIEAKLYDGSVTNAKELEAFQAEAAMLSDRVSELDDRVLEVMEEVEPLEQQLQDMNSALAKLTGELESERSSLGSAEAEIDSEVESVSAERSAIAEGMAEDLLTRYESLRKGLDGVGAAKLDGNKCTGCHLEIPSADMEQIRDMPEDAVPTCPECQRILVR